MRDQTPEALIAKARERAERPCVWSEGEVPRHVAEYLWDAVHDRHALLAYIDTLAAGDAARADADRLAEALRPIVTKSWPYDSTHNTFWAHAREALRQHDAAKEAERE